jgi:hypothetical protein
MLFAQRLQRPTSLDHRHPPSSHNTATPQKNAKKELKLYNSKKGNVALHRPGTVKLLE